jgi:hypothetical protein
LHWLATALTSKLWCVMRFTTASPRSTNTLPIAATKSSGLRVSFRKSGLILDSMLNSTGSSVAHCTKSNISERVESFVPGYTSGR